MPFENDSLLDDQAWSRDVPEELARGADLDALAGNDVPGDATFDDDAVPGDLCVHYRRLSDDQCVLRCDLSLDLTVYTDGSLEVQLAGDPAPLAKIGVDLAGQCGGNRFLIEPLPLEAGRFFDCGPNLLRLDAIVAIAIFLAEERHSGLPFDGLLDFSPTQNRVLLASPL